MDTGLVEGYIFLAEVLYMFGEERQHVRLAVIGLFAERLVRQRADAAVALQGALADLEQHAQVLVVEKPDPVHRVRGFAGRLHGEQHLVLTVEPFHHLLHPVLEIVAGKQFHVLRPPSFGSAARAQRVVAFQLFRCRGFARDGAVFEQAVYFRLPVAALAAQHDIGDALFAAHALEGAATHVQQVRRLHPMSPKRRTTDRRSSLFRKVYGAYRHNKPMMHHRYAARWINEVRLAISLPIISLSGVRVFSLRMKTDRKG